MKRILSLFFVFAALTAWTQEKNSTFNWSNPVSLTPSYTAPTEDNRSGDYVGGVKFTSGDITFEVDDSEVSEQSRRARFYFNYATKQVELRAYSGSYITVTAAEGRSITTLILEGPQSDKYYLDMLSPADGVTCTQTPPLYDRITWTVPAGTTSVRFYAEDRTQLTRTIVTTTNAAAVTDIAADGQPLTSEYYTLQGHRLLHRPTAPGLYLERRGSIARKVLIH
ncbi:MAG: hypothetical protein ACI30N_09045 [Muribaculaceae bacterium]